MKKFFKKLLINTRPPEKRGFTLVELMVSISIFSIVMVIVIGALLMLNSANKKAQALRAVVDNINFAIEDMTRNIKTGKEYACGFSLSEEGIVRLFDAHICNSSDEGPQKGIILKGRAINTLRRECILYFFQESTEEGQPGLIKYATSQTSNSGECHSDGVWNSGSRPITAGSLISPEVDVNNASFAIVNPNPDNENYQQQPIVIININGVINTDNKFKTPFNVQTTVSQRSSIE